MKINLKTLLSIGLVISSLLVTSSFASGEENKESNFQKWEYKVTQTISSVGSFEDNMNRLGREGWELVAVIRSDDNGKSEFIFKRPICGAYPVDGGQ